MYRKYAVFTLFLQSLAHSANMAMKHDGSAMWFLCHLTAGVGAIAILCYDRPQQ